MAASLFSVTNSLHFSLKMLSSATEQRVTSTSRPRICSERNGGLKEGREERVDPWVKWSSSNFWEDRFSLPKFTAGGHFRLLYCFIAALWSITALSSDVASKIEWIITAGYICDFICADYGRSQYHPNVIRITVDIFIYAVLYFRLSRCAHRSEFASLIRCELKEIWCV